ncbi:MAG: hypothetical protein JJU13_06045 [Balneolaceae bacterium]|nr:hypothetical protein [Balneolaceae bacterium]
MKKAFTLGLILIIAPAILHAQQQEPLADQFEERFKSETFSLGILLQSLALFSFEDDDFNGGRKFDLGATRLDFRGRVDGNFVYRLQLDFRRQTSVFDAQVGYLFSDNFRMIAGAFKPYLSAELDPHPGNTDFINRARLVGTMMNSREIGVTALGESNGFYYRFGMYNGTGLSRSNDNRFMYTVRLGYETEVNGGALGVGFNGAINQTRMESVGNTGLTSLGDRNLYGAFIRYDGDVVFGTLELLQTRFEALQFNGNEETITGFYGTIGTRISQKDELLARWDRLDFDLRGDSSDLFTFGWNHQATRLISFQLNLLMQFDSDDDENRMGVAGNFQFQF